MFDAGVSGGGAEEQLLERPVFDLQLHRALEEGHERLPRVGHLEAGGGRSEYLAIQPVVAAILARAQQAGVAREDLAFSDLLLLQHGIGEAAEYTREVAPEAWRRIMLITLDGLRPDRRRPSPMPVPPLDDEQVVCSMRDWGLRRRR